AATARITMSRSLTMPTSRPFSTTGIDPQSCCFMSVAAWPSVGSGPLVAGWRVMISLAFIAPPSPEEPAGPVPGLARGADLEDLRAADRTDALRRRAPVLHGDWLGVLDLAAGLVLHAITRGPRSSSSGNARGACRIVP